MTHAAHIAAIEHELDGFHQSLVEYRQQMGAWYSRALNSVSHAADMPSLLGMDRVLRVGDSQRSVSLSDADFSTVARCPVGGVLKIESKFESAYDVPIGDIPVEVIGLDDGSSTRVMLDKHGKGSHYCAAGGRYQVLEGFGPKATTPYHYQLDHLGTPQELTTPEGEIVWSAHYRAYGQIARLDVGKIDNPLRFQGQYFDQESGLHYNRHRYYNPDIGRYLTPDPVKLAGGINGYQYALNPTGWVDPLGLACTRGKCPGQKSQASHRHEEETPKVGSSTHSVTYEQALNKALEWLLENDFRAEKPKLGKFGERKGQPIGMQTADARTGYRIEYDDRHGAHINVWTHRKNGPHYTFEGTSKTVFQLTKRFAQK